MVEGRCGSDESLRSKNFFAVQLSIGAAKLDVALGWKLTQCRIESHCSSSVGILQNALPFDARAIPPTVALETPQWLVLNKPVGWHSVVARTTDGAPIVEEWIAKHYPAHNAIPEYGLVHRLDRSTSGCLLVAKTRDSFDELRENFQSGFGAWAIGKRYLALVSGAVAAQGEFTGFFSSRHKGSAKVTVRGVGSREHSGTCKWTRVRPRDSRAETGDVRAFDLIEVELCGPGRRHQIRAGFSSIGHPLAGDTTYGGIPLHPLCNHGFAALHAWKLVVGGVEAVSAPPAWAEC